MPGTLDKNFLQIFNNNLVGMLLTDDSHRITHINNHLLKLSGLNIEEVVGKTGLELGFLDQDFVKQIWEKMALGQAIINQELSMVIKDGNKLDCLFSTEEITLDEKKFWFTTIVDISLRKKAQHDLEDVYNRVTDGFVAIDSNWNYSYVNKDAALMMNRQPQEVMGKHVWTEFPHLVGSDIQEAYFRAMKTQKMVHLEQYFPPTDIWYMHMIYPSPDALSVFFKDISFHKKAQHQIELSELRFRTLTRSAPVGIFETDKNGSTTYVNETWLSYTGMQLDEALGDGWLQAVHPHDRQQLIDGWHSKTANEAASVSQYRLVHKTGEIHWVNGNAVPVVNSDGAVTGYIGTITDITSLKNAMELLQKSEETLTRAQQISNIGNFEFDVRSGDLFWSQQLYHIFELEGTSPADLYAAYRNKFYPEDLKTLDDILNESIKNKQGYTFEHPIICSDGGVKHILAIGILNFDADGEVTIIKGTAQDITARKNTEQKLTERTHQLKELSSHLQKIREEERLHIAREIHDELGQQLTGLKMDLAWLMKKTTAAGPVVKTKFEDALALVNETVKSIRRIAAELRPSIIDDLGLNMAMDWQIAEFSERVGVAIDFKNSFNDEGIKPELSICLFRILQESLTNIAKHARATSIQVSMYQYKQVVKLTIADDGIGFNTAVKQNELSFGLMGIKERTNMLKGTCTITSAPGTGTRVVVQVPLT